MTLSDRISLTGKLGEASYRDKEIYLRSCTEYCYSVSLFRVAAARQRRKVFQHKIVQRNTSP